MSRKKNITIVILIAVILILAIFVVRLMKEKQPLNPPIDEMGVKNHLNEMTITKLNEVSGQLDSEPLSGLEEARLLDNLDDSSRGMKSLNKDQEQKELEELERVLQAQNNNF
jgi:hypothetical protein